MAPKLVRAPFHRSGWVYEEKVDGYRMLAYKDGARVRLVSRNGVDHTRRYPDVAAAFAQLKPSTLVLDGELAVFDDQLRSRFDWLRDPGASMVATPPVLIAFDMLYVKGRDVSQRPLHERRARLEEVVASAGFIYPVRGLHLMVWTPGRRWSSAATRAWSPRTRPACTRAGAQRGG